MSIHDEINHHLGKELFLLRPLIPGQKVDRTMFVSKDINNIIQPPWPHGKDGYRLAQARGWLDNFTGGYRVSVGMDPHKKAKNAFMARVDPVSTQVFDIRCINPKPGVRVFGRIVERDTFVALTWNYREHLNGKDFDVAVDECIQVWQRLFPKCPLFSGLKLDDYLSNAFPV